VAKPCACWIEAQNHGDAYDIDYRQRVTPPGEMTREHDIGGDPKAPRGFGSGCDDKRQSVDQEDVQYVEEERYATIHIKKGSNARRPGMFGGTIEN
jgi:hypothetical protein